MKVKKPFLVLVLLITTIIISFVIPKAKYTSVNILKELNIPVEFKDWKSVDFSKELNLKDDRYNFISDVFARLYRNKKGEHLLFLILDAGNFHNPKVCYTSSGFKVKDMGKVDFLAGKNSIKATSLVLKRKNIDMNLFYWLVIDKMPVNWTGQKIIEIWSSLVNKKKAGLMVRLEIPDYKRKGYSIGKDFIKDLNESLTIEQKEYLFGEQKP